MAGDELGAGVGSAVGDNPGPLTLDGTRTYRIGVGQAVLLDPGPDLPGQIERLRELVGRAAIEWVCLTHGHPDHAALARAACEAFGAPLAAAAEALARLGLDGRTLSDGDRLEIDGGAAWLDVVETPGHSPDSLSFFLRPVGWMFTGDTVLGEGSTLVAHPDGRMSSYLASLARLISLRPSRLLPGHGEPVEEAVPRLEAYRRHRLDRERQIRVALADGAASLQDIRERVYPDLPAGLESAAESSIRAHLAHLEEQGLPYGAPMEREEP